MAPAAAWPAESGSIPITRVERKIKKLNKLNELKNQNPMKLGLKERLKINDVGCVLDSEGSVPVISLWIYV